MKINKLTYPKRENAKKFKKVGGKAFPNDYNWQCPFEHWCRSWEEECDTCITDQYRK